MTIWEQKQKESADDRTNGQEDCWGQTEDSEWQLQKCTQLENRSVISVSNTSVMFSIKKVLIHYPMWCSGKRNGLLVRRFLIRVPPKAWIFRALTDSYPELSVQWAHGKTGDHTTVQRLFYKCILRVLLKLLDQHCRCLFSRVWLMPG